MPGLLLQNENKIEELNHSCTNNAEVNTNFLLIYDLQERIQKVTKEIDELSEAYLANMANLSSKAQSMRKTRIQNLFTKIKECESEKIHLLKNTEELVDKRIKKLESVSAVGLKTKILNIGKKVNGKKTKETRKRKRSESSNDSTANKGNKKNKPKHLNKSVEATDSAISSDEFDIPIDPNEETYCICHQVAYGEMIGCDNSDCPIEWFHFPCVGITIEPKGKWYCPKCTQNNKKK